MIVAFLITLTFSRWSQWPKKQKEIITLGLLWTSLKERGLLQFRVDGKMLARLGECPLCRKVREF